MPCAFGKGIIGNRVRIPNDAVTVIEELHCKMPLPFGEKAQCSKDPLVRKPA